MSGFTTTSFYGTVLLKDWVEGLSDGNSYKALQGTVSILTDEEVVGFKANRATEANWIARVEGPSGEAWNILGCQVRGVVAHGRRDPVGGSVLVVA